MNKIISTVAAVGAALAANAARIEIAQDHADALYKAGEEATFTVTVKDDAGALLKSGLASWTLDNFGLKKIAKGKADLAAGNPFTVKGKMDEEGFLRIRVNAYTNSVVWGVGYDVEKIRQNEPCPADFDAYWTAEKARLEREVPLDPKMTLDEKRSTAVYSCYRVNFATFNGKRVYGFMCVPKDASKAPFRVRVSVPGAGPGVTSAGTNPNEIYLVMNVHTFEPEGTRDEQQAHMKRQNAALAEKYDLPNKTSYCSNAGIAESREDYWYHDVMLGINRAVDWVCARPDVDLAQVTYTGSSQGGGFGLFLTYLNGHFTKSFVAVCAITGHFGYKQGREAGWPKLISNQRPGKRAVAERNAAYFDGVNFAARIKSPIRFIVGFSDQTCPPADVYAAYNVCPSKDKAIVNAIGSPHGWGEWYSKNRGKPGWIDFDGWLRSK
jgi:cephalosporin-C deacetylase-like acetyl esterase